ncbi:universal stress protein [Desulfovermiculus halophilus]|uniref:universal stress protein n=1 Tax=Desulfovermiculus halophilus TaxID=339722 RepID=UPI00047F4563|nr:universal stress protein [Desulfovermiculus halophilus]
MEHTILWPTEMSTSSLKALPHVLSLAEKYSSTVVVLYVAPDLLSLFPAYGNYPSAEHIQRFQDWEADKAKKGLQEICSKELNACRNVTFKVLRGDAAQEILKAAREEGVDMIVLSSRGHSFDTVGTVGSGFGSVAKKVAEESPVPVVLINPDTSGGQ